MSSTNILRQQFNDQKQSKSFVIESNANLVVNSLFLPGDLNYLYNVNLLANYTYDIEINLHTGQPLKDYKKECLFKEILRIGEVGGLVFKDGLPVHDSGMSISVLNILDAPGHSVGITLIYSDVSFASWEVMERLKRE